VTASAACRATLRVRGKDDNAGIARVEVAKRRGGKPIASRRLAKANTRGKRSVSTTVRIPASVRTAYVRITAVAGNASAWKAIRRRAR
jgi:hypothetical protein